MDIIEKLAADGALTQEQAARVSSSVQEMMDALRKDPALMKEAQEKLAGVGDFARAVKDHMKDLIVPMTATAVLGAALTAGSSAARAGIDAVKDKRGKSEAFKAMMESNPRLKNHATEDVHKAFDSLYRFNPHYAKDPFVAGTFVNETVTQDRLDVNTINQLVSSKDKLSPKKTTAIDFFLKSMPTAERHSEREHRMDRIGWAMDDQERKQELHQKKLKAKDEE